MYLPFDVNLTVVDGPNLFNNAIRAVAGKADDSVLYDYVTQWMDFDRLIGLRNPPALSTVIFHSGRQLGSQKGIRLLDAAVTDFWARQGANTLSSTEFIDLPGKQDTRDEVACPNCKTSIPVGEKREKGVDTAITTYLWETHNTWEAVLIVSDDADLVPPARSLKRRGKQVFCLVKPESHRRDLVQVCTSHAEIDVRFIQKASVDTQNRPVVDTSKPAS